MSDTDPTAIVTQLSTSLTALEATLAPLLAQPFQQLLDNSADAPLQQARLQVLASYVVHDLIWVYLKTAGVEPSTHPVMAEIDRLRGYFSKLKQAESGALPPAEASKPRMQVDKAAASRFISSAISSRKAAVDPAYAVVEAEKDKEVEAGPSSTHIRFEEEEVERLLEDKEEEGEGESEGMEVEQGEMESGKGKEKEGKPQKKKEAKRAALDPFAGYDQPSTPSSGASKKSKSKSAPSAASPAPGGPTPLSASAGKRKRKEQDGGAGTSMAAAGAEGAAGSKDKKGKKKLKIKGAK
ncbi:hypothetical protein JCM10207_007809 [Rhodosporidiobolus poonsookiae]